MRVWRCVHERFIKDAWTGEGARQYPGRWNPKGRPMVYASEHAALAVLEVMAGGVTATDLERWRLVSAEIPDDVPELTGKRNEGPGRRGAAFLDSGALAATVPSVVVPGRNVLLNPMVADWGHVHKEGNIKLDPRLWA